MKVLFTIGRYHPSRRNFERFIFAAKNSRFREQHLCTSGDGYAYWFIENAVLIVEYAIQRHAAGKSVLEAAMEGAKAFSSYFDDFVCVHCRFDSVGFCLGTR
jgi:hypothetical protein